MRPTGWWSSRSLRPSPSPIARNREGVATLPGQTAFTRMFFRAYSIAAVRVRLITPAFAALYSTEHVVRGQAGDGSRVNDNATALRHHLGQGKAHPVKHTGKGNGDCTLPCFNRHVADRSYCACRGDVVVQNVKSAKPIHRKLHHRLDLKRFAHVGLVKDGASPYLFGDSTSVRFIDVNDNDCGAFSSEQFGRRSTDARCRACDEAHFILEFAHDYTLAWRRTRRSVYATLM